MTGAHAKHVLEISSALERCGAHLEEHSGDRWSFLLSDGAELQTTALMDGGWLLFDVPLPESRVPEARVTNHESRLWQLLQWNGTLPGGAKFAALPAGPAVHVRAEVPLDDDVNLLRRVGQACAGLKAASAKFCRLGAAGSPLPKKLSIDLQLGLRDGPWEPFETARRDRASSVGASSARTVLSLNSSGEFSVRPEEPPFFPIIPSSGPFSAAYRGTGGVSKPALSHVEGGSFGENPQSPEGEGARTECDPAVELAAQCRESGWTFAERSGKLVVDLEVPDAFQQAAVEPKAQRGVAVSVDVTASGEPLAMPCQEALALLLLRACGVVRMVRAAVEDVGSGTAARFEVLFSDTPCSAELAHAFSALSVACRIAGREAAILQHDEIVARAYLKNVSRGPWIVSRTTDHGK